MIKTNLLSVQIFRPRQFQYCVIIGVVNEGIRFTEQLKRLTDLSCNADIIIADGGSTDGATAPDQVSGQVHALIVDKRKFGLSGQYQGAIEYALAQGFEGVIMMDGNGKDGMEAVQNFISALEQGADLIQGSRFLPGGSCRNTPIARMIAIRCIFTPLMNLASGFNYTDAINGFKGLSRNLLVRKGLQPFRPELSIAYRLQYYINYRAPRLGVKVIEIPVARDYPDGGKVPTKIHSWKSHFNIILALIRTCLGSYNPHDS